MDRRGVSVIEVLFAIGIVAIGLLGVIALLPVALHTVGRGNAADRAARIAANSLTVVHSRSMLEPGQWWWRNRGVTPTVIQTVRSSTNGNDRYRAFAIDPRFVARNGLIDYNGPTYVGANLFPYVQPGATSPRMERITLDSGFATLMAGAVADRIFVSSDDLVFDLPPEKDLPPAPQFGDGVRNSTNGRLGTQRQYNGEFSWMLTLVPKYDASSAFNDEYILSVVVYQRRDPTFAINNVNERVVSASSFPGGGLGGGEVTLQSTVSADELALKSGNWVLLMSTIAPGQVFRWYHIVDTESEPRLVSTGPSVWERDVTLEGPDWRSDVTTEVALISNVIHVMERTVRLGSTNLWMP